MLMALPSSAQSLLNNGNLPGGNGGLIGPQGPVYSADPRNPYVPGQNNQMELGRASKDAYAESSGSHYRIGGYR